MAVDDLSDIDQRRAIILLVMMGVIRRTAPLETKLTLRIATLKRRSFKVQRLETRLHFLLSRTTHLTVCLLHLLVFLFIVVCLFNLAYYLPCVVFAIFQANH